MADNVEEICIANEYNLRNKGASISIASPSTSTNTSPTSKYPTTFNMPKLDYNVVKDLKKTKENISIYQLCKITQQLDILLKVVNGLPSDKGRAIVIE